MKKTSDMGCVVGNKAEAASEVFEMALHEPVQTTGVSFETLDYVAEMSIELAALALKANCGDAAKYLLQASRAARREAA